MDEKTFDKLRSEPCILGVDPGATNTGWVILHEATQTVLHSSTIKRDENTKPFAWAKQCCEQVKAAALLFNITKVAVEGVEEPNVYHNGKKNMLRPIYLINTAIVAGAVAADWEHLDPVIVRPAKNGSAPPEEYPEEMNGTRPKWLHGAKLPGVRKHERSSYDVAKKGLMRYKENYRLDQVQSPLAGKTRVKK